MISEWMKVMLEEIARKKTDAEQAETERLLRSGEQSDASDAGARASGDKAGSSKA